MLLVNLSRAQRFLAIAYLITAPIAVAGAAQAQDPIVGTWVGTLTQPEMTPFETRLTFVSPKGGVSRYPTFPCGGILTGDRKGTAYEYEETISWGGMDENAQGCIGGLVRITIDGDTMKFDWSATYNGQESTASGEFHRQGDK